MNKKVLTPADALAAYERAFRSGHPEEVEHLLRDMINVQVAVIEDKEAAIEEINRGKKLNTISVPYGSFLGKVREWFKESASNEESEHFIFVLESNFIIAQDEPDKILNPVRSTEEVIPGRTYVLLKKVAGYSKEQGLTFSGDGEVTGFEGQPEQERREKFTEGRFQLWREHAEGAWERSARLASIYYPFIDAWAERVLSEQWKDTPELKEQFVQGVLWAFRIAALLHDVGKLNANWQEIVWENEKKIRGKSAHQQNELIARTSPLADPCLRKQLRRPPPHAPFAYPFLKTLLRIILGDYRIWDSIALAAARHHSLEVAGRIEKGRFQPADGAEMVLQQILSEVLSLSKDEWTKIKDALSPSLHALSTDSEADEPPSPSDDFYFIYCLANRMVKICDWEDASERAIELPDIKGDSDETAV